MHQAPGNQGSSLETIARNGSLLQRIAARAPTYLADFREKPAWLPMFVFARTMAGRRLHWLTASRDRSRAGPQPTLFDDIVRDSAVMALRSNGFCPGFQLPPRIAEDICDFARATPCFGNFDRRLEFVPGEHANAEDRFGCSILSGHYFERTLDCEALVSVQRDPLLQDVASGYLGAQARLIRTRLWWSFPTRTASESDKSLASLDKFHFDLDDWRMLKFFFYLTPVDETSGPHVYVRGSHSRRRLKHQLTLVVGHDADDVLDFYGHDKAVTVTGPAGCGFVEDPFGFHMGTVPTQRPRLMMEVGFGVSRPLRRDFHGEPVFR